MAGKKCSYISYTGGYFSIDSLTNITTHPSEIGSEPPLSNYVAFQSPPSVLRGRDLLNFVPAAKKRQCGDRCGTCISSCLE
ncbi:uncharacterized protein [Chiloscyllium punctatum]|uniref:uncharacterized protein isoform X3 n=1 Tax=Chiloscyllium punctatum TaxID=137246 RepID=UPI003B63C1FE